MQILFALIFNPIVLENLHKPVLSRQTGVHEVAFEIIPLTQASVVEHLQVIRDNERDDIVAQAFLEKKQAPYSTIAILEWMDALKSDMEVNQVFERF